MFRMLVTQAKRDYFILKIPDRDRCRKQFLDFS